MNKKPTQAYFSFITGLRGIAALMVAFSHALIILNVGGAENTPNIFPDIFKSVEIAIFKLLLIIFNSEAAVIIFFLISGFVLNLSLERYFRESLFLPNFFIRRFIRLYPPYLFSIFVALILLLYYPNNIQNPTVSNWFTGWFSYPLTSKLIAENLTLRSVNLNINAWTLKIEFYMMFVMPLLVYIKKRTNFTIDLLILLLIFSLSFYRNQHINGAYLYPFYAGILISKWGNSLCRFKLLSKRIIFFISLFILLFSPVISSGNIYIRIALETLSAWYMISYLLYINDIQLVKFLGNEKIQKIGEISYSFYLIHPLFLYFTALMILKYAPQFTGQYLALVMNLIIGFVSVFISLFVANLLYRFIEYPSLLISKKF